MARFLGGRLASWLLRAVSMKEQDLSQVDGFLSPKETYFRRDRHVHPTIDPTSYRLRIDGTAREHEFTLDDLESLPRERIVCVMECSGNGNHWQGSAGLIGQAHWEGPRFETVLEAAGGAGNATNFVFHGLDGKIGRFGYHYGLALDELRQAGAILALRMNGEALPRRNGFPLRLVVPGVYSMSHVKWIGRIQGKTTPHQGIHNTVVFVNKEKRGDQWVKVQARWIGLKSLITRCRPDGEDYILSGWAWGGARPISRVSVSLDAGNSWQEASLTAPDSFFHAEAPFAADRLQNAWSAFSFRWKKPAPGLYRIGSRSFDDQGNEQDLVQNPNVNGHYNQTRVKWRDVRVP
jgi:DMSO/TMAO reductase YedYZ molybdopterin-dependent catalytic subunit